jgi:hypothetical protein
MNERNSSGSFASVPHLSVLACGGRASTVMFLRCPSPYSLGFAISSELGETGSTGFIGGDRPSGPLCDGSVHLAQLHPNKLLPRAEQLYLGGSRGYCFDAVSLPACRPSRILQLPSQHDSWYKIRAGLPDWSSWSALSSACAMKTLTSILGIAALANLAAAHCQYSPTLADCCV